MSYYAKKQPLTEPLLHASLPCGRGSLEANASVVGPEPQVQTLWGLRGRAGPSYLLPTGRADVGTGLGSTRSSGQEERGIHTALLPVQTPLRAYPLLYLICIASRCVLE